VVLTGNCTNEWGVKNEYVFKIEVEIDGAKEVVEMPFHFTNRRTEVYWNYALKPAKHTLKLRLLNPDKRADIVLKDLIVYK
jgi:hypothetical protein